MNKNTSIIMASAVAAILALGVVAVTIPHQAFAGSSNPCCDPQQPEKKIDVTKVAVGGNGGSGGAGGAGGEGGNGGHNDAKDNKNKVDQDANGGDSNGGHGGNANGGLAAIH